MPGKGRSCLHLEFPSDVSLPHATTMLGYGFLSNPIEVLFGPSLIRQQALDSIEQQPELAPVVAHARDAFERPLRDRFALLGQYAMLN